MCYFRILKYIETPNDNIIIAILRDNVFVDWVNEGCCFSQSAVISWREQAILRWEEDDNVRFVPGGMFKVLAKWNSQLEDISPNSAA